MSDKRAKIKARKTEGQWMRLPYSVLETDNYAKLSAPAVKLLIDVFHQYNGRNNGELLTARSYMKKRGWKCSDVLHYATLELEHYGFIVKTMQGGKNSYSRFGVTWLQLDSAEDVSLNNAYVKTKHVPNLHKHPREQFKRPKRKQKAKVVVLKGGKDKGRESGTKSDTV